MPASPAQQLFRDHLVRCGYEQSLLSLIPAGRSQALVAFAMEPSDVRTACIAVGETDCPGSGPVADYRHIGAPVLLLRHAENVYWWKVAEVPASEPYETIPVAHLDTFFEEHRQDLSPDALYRAKTAGQVRREYQMEFVDLGLMPYVEGQLGEHLAKFVAGLVADCEAEMPRRDAGITRAVLQVIMSSLAAKILQDKAVPGFRDLRPTDPDACLAAVARHYGEGQQLPPNRTVWRQTAELCVKRAFDLSSLALVTTETLAQVYEKALVTPEIRKAWGTHCTPGYLVDYMVWQLEDWVRENIPCDQRHVFEPACGPGAFLTAALRMLRQLLPPEERANCRQYLREHLHGIDIDDFAIKLARLGLTLADVPHPNGWDLRCADVFAPQELERQAATATIVLANPPFAKFTASDRAEFDKRGQQHPLLLPKAAEMMRRCLTAMPAGGVFGIIVPDGVLYGHGEKVLRQMLVERCQIAEICRLPDKVFSSNAESALIIGRKQRSSGEVRFRRVRNEELYDFRLQLTARHTVSVRQNDWMAPDYDLRIPVLRSVWQTCLMLPKLRDIAEIGQGFTLAAGVVEKDLSRASPVADEVWACLHFPGKEHGIHQPLVGKRLYLPTDVIEVRRAGAVSGIPQVVLNYAPCSRGPWRLKALIDPNGHALSSRFVVFRPHDGVPLELIWGLLNSPLANAFMYDHSGKRDNLVGTLREIPIPRFERDDLERVVILVRSYLDLAAHNSPDAQQVLLSVDAELLKQYDLPPRSERQILDQFQNYPRPGVPFRQTAYFPAGFRPCIPLHRYLSLEYRCSTAGQLRHVVRPWASPKTVTALKAAVQAFWE